MRTVDGGNTKNGRGGVVAFIIRTLRETRSSSEKITVVFDDNGTRLLAGQ